MIFYFLKELVGNTVAVYPFYVCRLLRNFKLSICHSPKFAPGLPFTFFRNPLPNLSHFFPSFWDCKGRNLFLIRKLYLKINFGDCNLNFQVFPVNRWRAAKVSFVSISTKCYFTFFISIFNLAISKNNRFFFLSGLQM